MQNSFISIVGKENTQAVIDTHVFIIKLLQSKHLKWKLSVRAKLGSSKDKPCQFVLTFNPGSP